MTRAKGGAGYQGRSWESWLPAEIPEGESYRRLITEGRQARCLAALVAQGVMDPSRPEQTFPREVFSQVLTSRLRGDPARREEREREIWWWVRHDLEKMQEGWRPALPREITAAEVQWAEQLGGDILQCQRGRPGRHSDPAKLVEVLWYIALKARGICLQFTQEHAVRCLGWVPWELPRADQQVQAERRRLGRLLAWLTEGTERQASLDRPALLKRLARGKHDRKTGRGTPSVYRVCWDNWGGPFLRRVRDAHREEN